jgi:hypothetical protein
MKWSRDHVLTWSFRRDLKLTVELDRLKVISSGSVVMKIDAKVCFQNGHLAVIFEIRSGQNFVLI